MVPNLALLSLNRELKWKIIETVNGLTHHQLLRNVNVKRKSSYSKRYSRKLSPRIVRSATLEVW